MFAKALDELNRMPTDKPFFAVLQSLSKHTPYALPEVLPVPEATGFGELDLHLTAQRYSDWALGQFLAEAEKKPWFKDTLFVVIGDHGFGIGRQLSEIDLLKYHVPLLIIGPGVRETFGARNQIVGTQLDVIPTALGLLGKPFAHQCWGRNLLSLPEGDPGFGIIKPSGSDQTVALLRGNQILIKPPHGEPQLGEYALYPGPTFARQENVALQQEMLQQLAAFIQSAMLALRDNKVGVGDETVP